LRAHLLGINGSLHQKQLRFSWIYSRAVFRQETIQRTADAFLQALRTIAAEATAASHSMYTPSDFPKIRIDQQSLDDLMREIGAPAGG
jgi:non-ribosomal peptide synthase protein (TIGR01720 family)